MKVVRSNPKAFETLKLRIKSLQGLEGRVGWFPSAKYESGTPVAFVMALNELGHGKTPPRPTIRPTAINQREAWAELAAKGAKGVINGTLAPDGLMELITIQAEGDLKQAILDLTEPALSPITIELRAMKKRNPNLRITGAIVGAAARRVREPGYVTPDVSVKPLIDTGYAIATLTHTVEKT